MLATLRQALQQVHLFKNRNLHFPSFFPRLSVSMKEEMLGNGSGIAAGAKKI
jgi:hypothetical protein